MGRPEGCAKALVSACRALRDDTELRPVNCENGESSEKVRECQRRTIERGVCSRDDDGELAATVGLEEKGME